MVSGIILSGGQSKRMGSTKALLQLNGKPLIQYPIDLLKPLCSEVIIVTQTPDLYAKFNIRIITDEFKDAGPMGGIHSGLKSAVNHWALVLACDLPYVRKPLLQGLMRQINVESNLKAAFPLAPAVPGGKLLKQPLCALYSKDCIDYLIQSIASGKLSLTDSLWGPGIKTIPWLELDPEDLRAVSFQNLNTPQDLTRFNSSATL